MTSFVLFPQASQPSKNLNISKLVYRPKVGTFRGAQGFVLNSLEGLISGTRNQSFKGKIPFKYSKLRLWLLQHNKI